MAKSRRAGIDQRQDFEYRLLALSDKSKVLLIVLANWSRKNEASARSIAALEESGGRWSTQTKITCLQQQLQLKSPPDWVYSNPQSFSKDHLPLYRPIGQMKWRCDGILHPHIFQVLEGGSNRGNSLQNAILIRKEITKWFHLGLITIMDFLSPSSCQEPWEMAWGDL